MLSWVSLFIALLGAYYQAVVYLWAATKQMAKDGKFKKSKKEKRKDKSPGTIFD